MTDSDEKILEVVLPIQDWQQLGRERDRLRAAMEQIRDLAYRGTDDVALLRIHAVAVDALKT